MLIGPKEVLTVIDFDFGIEDTKMVGNGYFVPAPQEGVIAPSVKVKKWFSFANEEVEVSEGLKSSKIILL